MHGHALAPEAVRLVVWDLDDTFWDGTLSEAGIVWREDHAAIVRALSGRGIVNAICSKNDPGPVHAVLARHGMDAHFVFPSLSWDPKGPRLRALVDAVQLRPQTVLFIDDNPMNRAEAAHFVPGLQVADETAVPGLLADARLAGKPDPQLTRLAQYKLLERRQAALQAASQDTQAFLRESRITVEIEHDVALHEDRAIELINRTNQLNFTKRRLPEDADDARRELRELLAKHSIQAGIVRVRDRHGDYGHCGLYIQGADQSRDRPYLLHFAFSCRILGMGVETWLYRHLNRPILVVRGEVLTDVAGDMREIDWIATARTGQDLADPGAARPLAYVLARGGCDMRALAHYFAATADRIIDEAAAVRGGQVQLTCSVLLAAQAIDGAPAALVRDAAKLGYLPEDFTSAIASPPRDVSAVWLMNLHFGQAVPVLRHRETGCLLPASVPGANAQSLLRLADDTQAAGLDTAVLAHLRDKFEILGPMTDETYRHSLTRLLGQAPPGTRVFILLANDMARTPDGKMAAIPPMRHRNALTAEVAAGFPGVALLAPADFMSAEAHAALANPHHYDRLAYFRMFQHVMARVGAPRQAQ